MSFLGLELALHFGPLRTGAQESLRGPEASVHVDLLNVFGCRSTSAGCAASPALTLTDAASAYPTLLTDRIARV